MKYNALLVYPEIPPTYWGMNYVLRFTGRKATNPPLGLLTVAAMLPEDFNITLVDMNVTTLTDEEVSRADVIFCSAMIIQQTSMEKVLAVCGKYNKTVVAGGPYPTSCHEDIEGVTHFVLNEAEVTLPPFLEDFKRGKAKALYTSTTRPDITKTPPPRLDLIDPNVYSTMALQFSRGCPHNCEFCDITKLFGRYPRTKTPDQFVNELDHLYTTGFRGSVFVVDDNFIGNRKKVRELLVSVIKWQEKHNYPFSLFTEATVDLGNDAELMRLMVRAGFNMVFVGIETPVEETLVAVHKQQNVKTDLKQCVHRIQTSGLEVSSGFIVGFDDDPPDIFDRQIRFIQDTAIPSAMVGLLTVVPNTDLYERLERENRLIGDPHGNNTFDFRLNFIPKMDLNQLLDGYLKVISEIYKPRRYFKRCLDYLKILEPNPHYSRRVRKSELRAFFMSLFIQTFSRYGRHYWHFLIRSFLMKPRLLAESVTMAVKGHHFFIITRRVKAAEKFRRRVDRLAQSFRERASIVAKPYLERNLADLRAYRDRIILDIQRDFDKFPSDFKIYVEDYVKRLEAMMDEFIVSKRVCPA